MYQNYVVEIQQYQNGEFGHNVYWEYDENADKALLKAESRYYTVLAAAAVSTLKAHAAILFTSEGFPLKHECYKHDAEPEAAAPAAEPATEPEEEAEEEPETEPETNEG